jgi:dihydrodipicolinate synthase/N-acetylneuraminate lyase
MPIDAEIRDRLYEGIVIPAHPLALDQNRKLDERRQVALTRYYCDAGAGGTGIGVHTTQFAIRQAGLFEPVLRLGAETMRDWEMRKRKRLVKIAGVCGLTKQAIAEAMIARNLGYDIGLLSMASLRDATTAEMVEHCRRVSEVIPIFGFYLQPAVGGRLLDYGFWRDFLEIENVAGIKVAPFNRYQTLDVARALAGSGRSGEVALYTGNDDNIVPDLLTEFRIECGTGNAAIRFAGGLLGHWAVWTKRAVELLEEIKQCRSSDGQDAYGLLARSAETTDANAVLFDVRNNFAGCIAGLHEILRRQGLLAGRWCLDPHEDLSPGQMEEIDRICRDYPYLTDDDFIRENLSLWLQ